MIKLKNLLNEAVDKSKLKKIYDKLNKGDEVAIKYGSSVRSGNSVDFIVKKGKTTVGKAKVERITLVNKANPKGVKYYLYNRNGNISFAMGDMGATIDDIQINESVNEAQKVNSTSKKFLKGMKKIKVKGLGGYMPGVDYVYVDGNKYYFVDFEGDHMELKNTNTIKQLHKLHGSSLGESVNESKGTYFRTASEAADYARSMAEKKGYEIDEDDWHSQIALGGKYNRLRPGVGKTHSFIVQLLKNGKPQRKALSISLYGMGSGNYELTTYIN